MASKQSQPELHQSRDKEVQIVLIGKTGVGKSATGNTILNRHAFLSEDSSFPVTKKCQMETGEFEGQKLIVVDTPGLFGNRQDTVVDEIKSSVSQGLPVVFLVVLQLGTFTEAEKQIVRIIQKAFGEEAEHFTMALFTRGDDLKTEGIPVDVKIGEYPALRDLVRECRGGNHVFDNKDDRDATQVTELLQKINGLVQRNGGICCSELMSRGSDEDQEGDLETDAETGAPSIHRGANSSSMGTQTPDTLTRHSLLRSCLEGAFDGECAVGLCFGSLMLCLPPHEIDKELLISAVVFGGVSGAVTAATRYAVCRLIDGRQKK